MRKFLLSGVLSAVLGLPSVAQLDPQLALYNLNYLQHNPSYSGKGVETVFSVLNRTQYAGYQGTFDAGGAAKSQLISASVPITDKKIGVAALLINDKIGPNLSQILDISASKKVILGSGVFSSGVKIGARRQALDYSVLRFEDAGDPNIPTGNNGQIRPDFGAGISYLGSLLQWGIAADHITQPTFRYTSTAKSTVPRVLMAHLSLNIPVSYSTDVQPMAMIRQIAGKNYVDAGLMAYFSNKIELGGSIRLQDAISGIAGLKVAKNIKVNYAMEVVYAQTLVKAPISHEIMLQYAIKGVRIGRESIIRTPRYYF